MADSLKQTDLPVLQEHCIYVRHLLEICRI